VFERGPGPLPMNAFVEATGKPKSSVHRMLSTLVHLGFVSQDGRSGGYSLTLKLWRLGMPALAELDLSKLSPRHLEALMRAAGETVHMSVLDPSGGVVYVAKVECPKSIRVQTQIGRLNPAWCTATGRSMLAFHDAAADAVLAGPLAPLNDHTVTDPQRLRAILDDVRALGYAVTRGENHADMGGIAAPIRDYSGKVVASCGIAIPVFRMDRSLEQRCVPLVVEAAAAISAELGYQLRAKETLSYGT